jgi:hypothetical protein
LLVFFDDILIYNKSWEEHVQPIDKVLQILEEKQIYENTSKCSFGVQEVEYLGHIVSHEGVKVEHKKIKATREWKITKILNKLRVFLGFTEYYCNFVDNYRKIVALLTTLLNKEALS